MKLLKVTTLLFSSLSALTLLLAPPSFAATQRSADFQVGSTVGIGLFGLAYDYGIGPVSIGANIGSDVGLFGYGQTTLKYNARVVWRLMEQEGLSGGLLAGLQYDPGRPGSRAYLTPDVGFSMAYDFRRFNAPFALRLNVTLGVGNGGVNGPVYPDGVPVENVYPSHLFQRLTVGPNTSLELAYLPSDNLEITLGGGTWVGMRLKF